MTAHDLLDPSSGDTDVDMDPTIQAVLTGRIDVSGLVVDERRGMRVVDVAKERPEVPSIGLDVPDLVGQHDGNRRDVESRACKPFSRAGR